jgi:hypothetical protein
LINEQGEKVAVNVHPKCKELLKAEAQDMNLKEFAFTTLAETQKKLLLAKQQKVNEIMDKAHVDAAKFNQSEEGRQMKEQHLAKKKVREGKK